MMMQLKKKKCKEKEQIHTHKKTYTNMKNETHENYAQIKMPPKKCNACLFLK